MHGVPNITSFTLLYSFLCLSHRFSSKNITRKSPPPRKSFRHTDTQTERGRDRDRDRRQRQRETCTFRYTSKKNIRDKGKKSVNTVLRKRTRKRSDTSKASCRTLENVYQMQLQRQIVSPVLQNVMMKLFIVATTCLLVNGRGMAAAAEIRRYQIRVHKIMECSLQRIGIRKFSGRSVL